VYYGKKLIVSGGVAVVTDRLGTVRADTQGEAFAYYPYGEERSSTPDGRNKFATYFRDTIGQDYADQRYYNAGIGRFWNVDPGGMATGNPADPGSWNRYAYAEGDPINSTDRHGLFMCVGCGDDSGDDGDDGGDGGYGGGGGYSPVPGGGSGGGGGGSALPKCADLLSNTITSFLKSANSPLLTQDPSFVSQVMAEAQLVGVSPLLFAAETMESGYGTSVVATTMDNPFGLKSNNQNINYSGQGGVASAIVAEGNTLNNLVNNLGENLGQMYSGLPGLTDARGWNWLRPPAYCQSAGCPSFGTDLGKALVKMGGDPNNLKYPKGQVGKTKCQ
jgi:RHS repeat-associated protein